MSDPEAVRSTPDRHRPDAPQPSPSLRDMAEATRDVVRRLPGMALATVRYVQHRSDVTHELVDLDGVPDHAPDADRALPGDQTTVLRRGAGFGPLYRRTYRVEVEDPRTGPEELITRLLNDPNRASPTEVSRFEATTGRGRRPGAEFAVRMPGPWRSSVRVVERTPTGFTFVTLRGHMEAGEITFDACWGEGGRLLFTIESWARSGDRLSGWAYRRVPVIREMQLHMWVHVCEQVAAMAGGRQLGDVVVTTHRWKEADRG